MLNEKKYQFVGVVVFGLFAFFGVQVSKLSSRLYDLEFQSAKDRNNNDSRLKAIEEKIGIQQPVILK